MPSNYSKNNLPVQKSLHGVHLAAVPGAPAPAPPKPKRLYDVLDWAFYLPITNRAKLVIGYLVRCANKDGRCWPKQETIAHNLRLGRENVSRDISYLCKRGYLTKSRKGKARKLYEYQIAYFEDDPDIGF